VTAFYDRLYRLSLTNARLTGMCPTRATTTSSRSSWQSPLRVNKNFSARVLTASLAR
jgi:hypothetical protein